MPHPASVSLVHPPRSVFAALIWSAVSLIPSSFLPKSMSPVEGVGREGVSVPGPAAPL